MAAMCQPGFRLAGSCALGLQVPELGDVQLQRGLAAEAQRLWLQQAFNNSSGLVSDLQREVAAALTALGEMRLCRHFVGRFMRWADGHAGWHHP